MSQAIRLILGSDLRKGSRMLLAFCWISGIASGAAIYNSNVFVMSSLVLRAVRQAQDCTISVWMALMPVLLSGVAVAFSIPMMLFLLCFGKAFLFGLMAAGVLHCFGCAGWLIYLLFLFCDIGGMPVLYLYWLRSLKGTDSGFPLLCRFLLTLAVILGIWYTDDYIITPILARLIDF